MAARTRWVAVVPCTHQTISTLSPMAATEGVMSVLPAGTMAGSFTSTLVTARAVNGPPNRVASNKRKVSRPLDTGRKVRLRRDLFHGVLQLLRLTGLVAAHRARQEHLQRLAV